MRKAISSDEATGTSWSQPDPPTVSVYDLLNEGTIEWETDPGTRAVVILVPAFPQWMRTAFEQQKQRIARLAEEDLQRDIQATTNYVMLLQEELDRRTKAAKQKRLDDAAREIAKTDRKIEYAELKRRRGGRGFRQRPA